MTLHFEDAGSCPYQSRLCSACCNCLRSTSSL